MTDDRDAAARLEDLRRRRARAAPERSAGDALAGTVRELRRLERRLGGVAEAWQAVCPPDLVARTAIRSLRKGLLTIAVEDASTRYELDRLLRAGAERELARAATTTVRRVRLVIEPL